jgi:hypothetical protein
MSPSLQMNIVGTVTFLPASRASLSGTARYQLSAAVSAPGSVMAFASASANAGACSARDFTRPDSVNVPRPRVIYHSGIRGNWKKRMYQEASPCRLVTRALKNAPGCGTDIDVTVSRRSGNC